MKVIRKDLGFMKGDEITADWEDISNNEQDALKELMKYAISEGRMDADEIMLCKSISGIGLVGGEPDLLIKWWIDENPKR
jgi:hypothetical protein